MRVYSCPSELPVPKPDYDNMSLEDVLAAENAHKKSLKQYLIEKGYTGERTGWEVSVGFADGCARYMIAEGPNMNWHFCLIHLPYGDGWHCKSVEKMTRAEAIRNAETLEKITSLQAAERNGKSPVSSPVQMG